jgi:hypothetical protein
VTRLAFSGLSLRVAKEGEQEGGRKQGQEGKGNRWRRRLPFNHFRGGAGACHVA